MSPGAWNTHSSSLLPPPFGLALGYLLADRIERKWQIVLAAGAIAVCGLIAANVRTAVLLIVFSVLLTLSSNIMSDTFHAYQAELYPTCIRALPVGFAYSWSWLSAVFSAFDRLLPAHLRHDRCVRLHRREHGGGHAGDRVDGSPDP